MAHRYLADSVEGVVQLLAASYLRHGYYWYMTGSIPKGKSAETVDQKLISKYDIDVSEWERSRRKKNGIANAQYLRYGSWFVVLVTEGHHKIKTPSHQGGDAENLRDCRRIPIRCHGYSISYRRSGVTLVGAVQPKWHAHVRIDGPTYSAMKGHFERMAVHRSAENLTKEFKRVEFARYAPIRRQMLDILRSVNHIRKQCGFEQLPYSALDLRRSPVKVFKDQTVGGVCIENVKQSDDATGGAKKCK